MSTTQLWLYEHADGRHLAAPAGAAILAGDPQWYRVGPVDVQGVEASKEPPRDLQAAPVADTPAVPDAEVLTDAQRLEWLLPNLHPANFGLDFPGGYEWEDEAEFLRKWRAAIDAAMSAAPPAADDGATS